MKRKVQQAKKSTKVRSGKVAAAKRGKVKRQQVRAPGGARAGAGRQALYGEEKLEEKVSVRLNAEQATALYSVCEARRVNPNLFMREAALKRAGVERLGIGLEKAYGTLKEGKKLPKPTKEGLQLPVKCTASQKEALSAHCRLLEVDEGTFVKDSALQEAGLKHLTSEALRAQFVKHHGRGGLLLADATLGK